jgi:hypothetical protein
MKSATLFILMVSLAQFSSAQTMTVHKNDQTTVTFQLSQIDSITFTSSTSVGHFIVFDRSIGGHQDIFIANIDGTNIKNLTNSSAEDFHSRLNAANDKILFISDRSGQADVYIMNLDGSNVQRVTTMFGIEHLLILQAITRSFTAREISYIRLILMVQTIRRSQPLPRIIGKEFPVHVPATKSLP